MSETIQYFAYGANRDPKMLSWITGKPESELLGQPAVLEGYTLGVQRLDQVPDEVISTAPAPVSPRQILSGNWDDDFRSYVITPAEGRSVSGSIYTLTPDERERVRDWELIDFGWYKDSSAIAKTAEGLDVPVTIEDMGVGQEYDHEVDGLHYETWLNPLNMFEAIATSARREYDARTFAPEGVSLQDTKH